MHGHAYLWDLYTIHDVQLTNSNPLRCLRIPYGAYSYTFDFLLAREGL
jgi:hypothetical protein